MSIFNRQSITITIPSYPPSANRLWRTGQGRTYLSDETKRFYKDVLISLLETGNLRAPKSWKYFNVYIVLHPARRAGDVDNRIKPVLDAFTQAGFWDDDKQVGKVSCEFGAVSKKPKIKVRITPRKEKYLEHIEEPDWEGTENE